MQIKLSEYLWFIEKLLARCWPLFAFSTCLPSFPYFYFLKYVFPRTVCYASEAVQATAQQKFDTNVGQIQAQIQILSVVIRCVENLCAAQAMWQFLQAFPLIEPPVLTVNLLAEKWVVVVFMLRCPLRLKKIWFDSVCHEFTLTCWRWLLKRHTHTHKCVSGLCGLCKSMPQNKMSLKRLSTYSCVWQPVRRAVSLTAKEMLIKYSPAPLSRLNSPVLKGKSGDVALLTISVSMLSWIFTCMWKP